MAMGMGCKGSEPTAADYDDVAVAVGALLGDDDASGTENTLVAVSNTTSTSSNTGLGDVASMQHAVNLALGARPAGFATQGSGEVTGSRGGLTFTYNVSCAGLAGAALPACGPTTDVATASVQWNGSFTGPRVTATATRTGSWTLSNLQSDTLTFRGQGAFTVTSSFIALSQPISRTFRMSYDATYQDVLVSKASGRPIGGSIRYLIAAERARDGAFTTVDASFDVEAVVTFAADGTATLVLDGQRTYSVQRANGTVASVN
jgi:hypothetical protein